MFPRFLMSETMQQIGLVTFNAWALDGYLKVFWRNAPIWQLWPQVAVLSGLAVVFLTGARILARKWEAALIDAQRVDGSTTMVRMARCTR